MTFGVNVNHISNGLLSGAYPGLTIDTTKPAKPIAYNVIDGATIVNLLNVMLLPKPKVFVGQIKFSNTEVADGRSFRLNDPMNNLSWEYLDIGFFREYTITFPVIFTKIESTLQSKYSFQIFGYLFEYNI